MTEFSIVAESSKEKPGVMIVKISGFLDETTSLSLETKFTELFERGTTNYIFDCSELKYITSRGFAILVRLYDGVMERDGDIILVQVRKSICEIISMMNMTEMYKFKDSVESALAEF